MKKVVITHAKRTIIGSFAGNLASFSATELGSFVIRDLIKESGIEPSVVDEVIMGNVISSGLGQAPARQAAIYGGLPDKTETLTINKMCGSALKAVMLAAQAIQVGDANVVIAGGMESMSNAPYIVPKVRQGLKLGNAQMFDSLILDGLVDVYSNKHMGSCAEKCAKDFSFTREQLDAFAVASYNKAINAVNSGIFTPEITPVVVKTKSGEDVLIRDEEPFRVNFDKLPSLKPAFEKDGVVTAANASSLNDGASALLLMSEEKALELGLTPLVEIVGQSSAAKAPVDFTTAPADAMAKLLKKLNMTADDIDLFEINEAFAVVSLAVNELLKLNPEKVNVNGGAVALGHPLGASGARILTTLIYEMKRRNSVYGMASLCIGGGEASAIVVKNIRK